MSNPTHVGTKLSDADAERLVRTGRGIVCPTPAAKAASHPAQRSPGASDRLAHLQQHHPAFPACLSLSLYAQAEFERQADPNDPTQQGLLEEMRAQLKKVGSGPVRDVPTHLAHCSQQQSTSRLQRLWGKLQPT